MADVPQGQALLDGIARLRKQLDAVILAHYYQDSEIQDLADFVGDSLQLSQQAAKTSAKVIVFCGVHFMAETAKILNPTKQVLLPDLDAGCSLADRCPPDQFARWLRQYPEHKVVSYINCSAGVKALSDVICTSSNAEKIVKSFPEGTKIVFAPDRHLGAWVEKKTGRELVKWPGFCIVHEQFTERQLTKLKVRHPEAKLIAHPECEEPILRMADFIGSTTALLKFTISDASQKYIVGTESGIVHQMRKASPGKEFIDGPPVGSCACNECPHMKLNTMEKLYLCMRDQTPSLELNPLLREQALTPLKRMLEWS